MLNVFKILPTNHLIHKAQINIWYVEHRRNQKLCGSVFRSPADGIWRDFFGQFVPKCPYLSKRFASRGPASICPNLTQVSDLLAANEGHFFVQCIRFKSHSSEIDFCTGTGSCWRRTTGRATTWTSARSSASAATTARTRRGDTRAAASQVTAWYDVDYFSKWQNSIFSYTPPWRCTPKDLTMYSKMSPNLAKGLEGAKCVGALCHFSIF